MTAPDWAAPPVDRAVPERIADERVALEQLLDYQRSTLLHKCAGLSAEQLKQRAAPPSTLSLLGLIRHMSDVERWWFRMHAAQLPVAPAYDPEMTGADFDDLDQADAAHDLESFDREVDASRTAVADLDLDLVVPSRGDHPERTRDLRWIFLHMIEEYARHNGHADLIREAVDGTTGD